MFARCLFFGGDKDKRRGHIPRRSVAFQTSRARECEIKLATHLARPIISTCTRYVRLSDRALARFRHLPTRLNTDRRANWPLVAATGHGCRKITAFSRSGPDGRERFYETVSDIRVRRTPKITVCVGRRRLCISP